MPATSLPTSHERMVATLAEIAVNTRRFNPFVGENDVAELRAKVAEPSGIPATELASLYARLGTNELRLGNTEAAVEALVRFDEQSRAAPRGNGARPSLFPLGMAWMRRGETENCVSRHTPDSCLFPIRGGGVHAKQEGSRNAIRAFSEILEHGPNLATQWLLNLAYMTIGEYPDEVPEPYLIPPATFASDEEFPRFFDAAPKLGLNAFGLAGGAIADDFDGDGFLDLFLSDSHPAGQASYFHNDADGSFSDRTVPAGLTGITGGLNALQADYDNDGRPDVLVLRGAWMNIHGRHPKSLLHNGGGTFSDRTYDAGLALVFYPSQTAAWADYDGDGDLDLYVGNESVRGEFPCELFRNDGNGKFTDVAAQAGVQNGRFAKGVVWGDYDGDDRPDLYVSNLGEENRLYHNDGGGKFTDVAQRAGVTKPLDSFASWFWDFDNDGAMDLYVASYYQALGPQRVATAVADMLGLPGPGEPACLYAGNGRGEFREVAVEQRVGRQAFPMGANFGDLDNDGWLDFFLGTGFPEYEGLLPDVMYRNRGGTGFSNVTTAGGFGHLQKGHGIAFADFDNDGDEDVFAKMGGALPGDAFGSVLYENPGFGRHWISLILQGVSSNRSAIGARIRVSFTDGSDQRSVTRWVCSGGSFGANPLRQHIGLGAATVVESVEVHWPTTGKTQTYRDLPADRFFRIVEGSDSAEPVVLPILRLGGTGDAR